MNRRMNRDLRIALREMELSEADRQRRREQSRPHKRQQLRHTGCFVVLTALVVVTPAFVPATGYGTAMGSVVSIVLTYHLLKMVHHFLMVRHYHGKRYPLLKVLDLVNKLMRKKTNEY